MIDRNSGFLATSKTTQRLSSVCIYYKPQRWIPSDSWCLTGADLSDSPGKPSIAAVVASMDSHYMLSADAVSVQRLIEPPTNSIGELLRGLVEAD